MTDKQQNEQQDELRDLDVSEQDAEGVKGGMRLTLKGEGQDYMKVVMEEVRVTN